MTIGSFNKDYRINVAGIEGPIGLVSNSSWSGEDDIRVRREKPKAQYDEFDRISYKVYAGNRKVTLHQNIRVRRYLPSDRPVKRARTVDHPYSRTWFQEYDDAFLFNDGRYISTAQAGYRLHAVPSGSLAAMQIRLLGKLREAVAGSDFNVGIVTGELHQTVNLITDSARRLASALISIKHGNVQHAARTLVRGKSYESLFAGTKIRKTKDVAENLLQIQYGWLPLLNDVYAGAQFLSHFLTTPLHEVIRVTVKDRHGTLTNSSPGNILEPAAIKWNEDPFALGRGVSYLTKISVKATISERDVAQLSGLLDPLSVAWELTPWSFVADWFIPIGSWMSARALSNAISGVYVVSTKQEGQVRGMKLSSPQHLSHANGYYSKIGSFTRTVSGSLDVPLPEFKPLGKVASWQHCINAVALLVSPASKGYKVIEPLTKGPATV